MRGLSPLRRVPEQRLSGPGPLPPSRPFSVRCAARVPPTAPHRPAGSADRTWPGPGLGARRGRRGWRGEDPATGSRPRPRLGPPALPAHGSRGSLRRAAVRPSVRGSPLRAAATGGSGRSGLASLPWPRRPRCACGPRARLALPPSPVPCSGALLRVLTLPVGRAAGGGPGAAPRVLLNSPGAGTAEIRGQGPRSGRKRDGRAERAAEAGREGGWRDRPTGWDRKRGEKPPSAGSLCPPGGRCSPGRKGCFSLSDCHFTLRPEPLPPSPRGSRRRAIGTGITGICPLAPIDVNLNFQQMWKVTFTCVCISFT